jgi:hypothetical protein
MISYILGSQSRQLEICQLIEVLAWCITDYEYSSDLPTGHILEVIIELTAAVLVNREFKCHRFRCFYKFLALPRNFEACSWSASDATQYVTLAWGRTQYALAGGRGIPIYKSQAEDLLTILHILVMTQICDMNDVVVLLKEVDKKIRFFRGDIIRRDPPLILDVNMWDVIYSTRLIIRLELLLWRLADLDVPSVVETPVLENIGKLILDIISCNIDDQVVTAVVSRMRLYDYGLGAHNALPNYLLLIHEVKHWLAQRIPLPDDADNNQEY